MGSNIFRVHYLKTYLKILDVVCLSINPHGRIWKSGHSSNSWDLYNQMKQTAFDEKGFVATFYIYPYYLILPFTLYFLLLNILIVSYVGVDLIICHNFTLKLVLRLRIAVGTISFLSLTKRHLSAHLGKCNNHLGLESLVSGPIWSLYHLVI